ncbi:MAG: hypothetical protein ACRERU_11145, partial [Methylococcales bacterium]
MTDLPKQPLSQSIPPAVDTQEARRATGVSTGGRGAAQTSSEVLEKASRRRFDADYKQRILAESEACIEPGEI